MGLSLKPLSDRVVVEPAAAEEKSSEVSFFQILHKKNLSKALLLLQALGK